MHIKIIISELSSSLKIRKWQLPRVLFRHYIWSKMAYITFGTNIHIIILQFKDLITLTLRVTLQELISTAINFHEFHEFLLILRKLLENSQFAKFNLLRTTHNICLNFKFSNHNFIFEKFLTKNNFLKAIYLEKIEYANRAV